MAGITLPPDTPFVGNGASTPGTPGKQGTFNGLIPVKSAKALADEERAAAEKANNEPVIQGLAGHVRKCFTAADDARKNDEQRMLENLRARRGEYDPDTLSKIKQTGGAEIYMMLTSNKCRAATAWLRDTLLGNGLEKPWTLSPTKEPELPPEAAQEAVAVAGEMVQQLQDMLGGPQMVPDSQVQDLLELARDRAKVETLNEAKKRMERMETRMEDQLQEGGFLRAFSEFLDDLSTFPAAVLKGPVVRRKPQMTWAQGAEGEYEPVIETKHCLEWERVDPFNCYPAPGISDVQEGYFIERHHMRPQQLEELIGVEGYSDKAIRAVIDAHGQNGLKDWLAVDTQKADAEGRSTTDVADTTEPTIDALQFWGTVLGKDLVEFGMEEAKVPDQTKTYHCEVWVIGQWVIKATLNYDPFGRKPYYKCSYENIPGMFWGNAPADLVRDCQIMCNNAARSLANNMAISSGPQVGVLVDRMPEGEDVTNLYPWKIHQFVTDPYGANGNPITFFQPHSNASELMGIYEKYAVLADEYSGIPRYMTGDASVGGAGRTASGMSMLMSNAGKSIKSVVASIDTYVLGPAIERLYYYNMKYGKDPELKGDVKVVARGAASLIVKEQAQVRRNEFMSIVLNSPVVTQIVGEEAITELLRSAARGLDMDVEKIIPSREVIRARLFQQQQQMIQQQQAAQQQAMAGMEVPLEQMDIQRGPNGEMTGMRVMPGQRQKLQNGAAPTDNFAPQRGA